MNKLITKLAQEALEQCIGEPQHPAVQLNNYSVAHAFIDQLVKDLVAHAESLANESKNIYSTDERDYYVNRGIDTLLAEIKTNWVSNGNQ